MARGDERVDLRVRTTPEIKDDVTQFAERNGISLNSACNLLLVQALRLERLRDQADSK
jgi:hypothetical protein